jgi:hypothetical protein
MVVPIPGIRVIGMEIKRSCWNLESLTLWGFFYDAAFGLVEYGSTLYSFKKSFPTTVQS